MPKFSSNFLNLVTNDSGSLDYDQYNSLSVELRKIYDSVTARNLVGAWVLYAITLWAVAEQVYFLAALTFLIGNGFDRKSMSASMMSDVVVSNRYLAKLINQRSISSLDRPSV
jgi:hypothetical protein